MRGASSCLSQGQHQGEPWGASPRASAPTYLPTYDMAKQLNSEISSKALGMKCLLHFGVTAMKEDTSAQLSGRGELHGGLEV